MICWGGFSRDFVSGNDADHSQRSHPFQQEESVMRSHTNSVCTLATLAAGCLVACSSAPPAGKAAGVNPYAPWRSHAYRHGAVPTRETAEQMHAWRASMQLRGAPVVPRILVF